MNQSIYRISLDIHSVASQLSFGVNRGDNMRRLIITLTENGKTYEITDDCYAIFTTVKTDGNPIANDCTIKDNTIIYDLTEQTTALAGTLDCSVILYNSRGEQLTSPRLTVIVYETTHQNIDVESASEYTTLVEKISEADAKIEEMDGLIESVTEDRDNGVYDGTRFYTASEGYVVSDGVEKILIHKIQNFDENIRVNDYVLYGNGVLYRITDIPDDNAVVVSPRGSFRGEKGEQGQEGESIYSVNDNVVISENPNKDEEYTIDTSIVAIWDEDRPVNIGDAVVDGLGNVYIIDKVAPAGLQAKVYWTGTNIKGKDGEGIPSNMSQNDNKTIIVDGSVVNGNWNATFIVRQGGKQRPICTQYTDHTGAKAEMVTTANSAKFKFVNGSTDPQSYMEIFEDRINFSKPITVQGNPVGGGESNSSSLLYIPSMSSYGSYNLFFALPKDFSNVKEIKIKYTLQYDNYNYNVITNNADVIIYKEQGFFTPTLRGLLSDAYGSTETYDVSTRWDTEGISANIFTLDFYNATGGSGGNAVYILFEIQYK